MQDLTMTDLTLKDHVAEMDIDRPDTMTDHKQQA